MKDLNNLTNIIREIVPESMELKFGCRVEIPKHEIKLGVVIHKDKCLKTNKEFVNLVFPDKWNTDSFFVEELIILGNDITLDDILIALDRRKIEMPAKTREHFGIASNTAFITSYLRNGKYTNFNFRDWNWQFGKPLYEQSQTTISFLTKTLLKNYK